MRRRRSRYRRGSFWHEPEHLAGQAERDVQLGRTSFYVYVLDTDLGHYVGHTWNVRSRVRQHLNGEVESTAGSNPTLLWQSRPFGTREDASSFEASLKSLRDQRAARYAEIVGFPGQPWAGAASRRNRAFGSGCLLPILALLLAVAVIVVGAV